MPNFYPSKKQPDLEELEADLAAIKKEHRSAVRQYGEDSREAREAGDALRIIERKVSSAKETQEQREEQENKLNKMSTAEVIEHIDKLVPRSSV